MTADLARRVLLPVTAGLWAGAVLLTATFVSWWLCLLLLVGVCSAVPLLVRTRRRSLRRHAVAAGGPDAAGAGWAELLDTSADLGEPLPADRSVRTIAERLAEAHQLDADARRALRTVVTALEHAWYGPGHTGDPAALSAAVTDITAAMYAAGHPGWLARYWPRSVRGTVPPATEQTPGSASPGTDAEDTEDTEDAEPARG